MTQGFELFAKIGGDASGLQRALGNAQRAVGGAGQAMERLRRVGVRAFQALGAAAAAATATLVAFTRSGLQTVDDQAKLARSLDASIDGLRGVQIAAADAGVDAGALGTSLQMLNSRLAEAARGTGTAAQAMERLGLDANELSELDVDERMAAIADRMQELGFSAGQAQDELAQLGIRNRQLALLMVQGGDAIRSARQEVDEFGLSINEVDAQRIEAANDAFRRIGRIIEAVKIELANQLAPIILHVSTRFNEMVREAGGLRNIVQPQVEALVRSFGILMNGVTRARITFLAFSNALRRVQVVLLDINRVVGSVLGKTIQTVTDSVVSLIEAFNRIPGLAEIDTTGLRQFSAAQEGVIANQERMAREARKALLDGQSELHRLLGEPFPSENFEEWLQALRDSFDGTIEHMSGAFSDLSTDITTGLGDVGDKLSELDQFAIQAARNMQNAFAQFFFNPFEEGLKGMLRGFVDLLRQMIAELAARAALMAFLNFLAGGSGTVATMAQAVLNSGTRERGGPVMSQQPYMVGERGPEMFVPHGAGRIVPNNQLQGNGGAMVTVNINAEDPGAEGRIRTMVERELAPQIVQAAVGQTFGRLQRPRFA